MLLERWAVPLPDPAARRTYSLGAPSASAPAVLDVLPGEIHAARLAADLTESGRPPRWVRLAPYDLDQPALDALAVAVAERSAEHSGVQHPWPVVVESDDRALAERFLARIAVAEAPGRVSPGVILHHVRPERGLGRRTPATVGRGDALERLTWGRPALYDSVLEAGWRLRPGELAAIVQRSRRLADLTARLAARLLADLPLRATTLLGLAALLGYCHPDLGALRPALDSCADLPWWLPLTGGWWRFEPAWRDAVRAAGRGSPQAEVSLLGPVVSELVEHDAVDAAIELCLDAGYPGTASDLILGIGPDLLAAGRPLALRRWFDRLPWAIRRRHRALAARVASQAAEEAGRVPGEADAGTAARSRRGPRRAGVAAVDHRPDQGPRAVLVARLLGPVEISVGGRRVEQWHGRKGTLVLAYLLLHRDRPVPRDVLATNFWPDAAPEIAHNRMHVTVHTLRADLESASAVPVVLFDHGYRLNPELSVRLDTETIEEAVARGRRAEQRGDVEAALAAYREAAREYRGDLLSDHPYDGWTLLPREHYRTLVLDVLGRTATLAFGAHRYAESVEAAQRLLGLDFYREDVHRLLMRTYARLGRQHLALHQFETCARQLRRELGIAPARETVELYHRIRARAPV